MKQNERQQRHIAKAFLAFRRRYGYSQVKLAEALGISRRTIQYVETGRPGQPTWSCIPHPETLKKFRVLQLKEKQTAAGSGGEYLWQK